MNTIKKSVIALLLGAAAANEFVPEAQPNLFKLDDDQLVINAAKDEANEQNNFFLDSDKFIEVPVSKNIEAP
jgi:hypothetical protein